jgi:hypothetical protein
MQLTWRHVADLPPLQRDRNSEVRLRIVESEKGFAVEMRKHFFNPRSGEMNAGAPALSIFADRLPALVLALDGAYSTIRALQQAQRQAR